MEFWKFLYEESIAQGYGITEEASNTPPVQPKPNTRILFYLYLLPCKYVSKTVHG
jgi:hypothetical protein